ncbi:MAG: hypothetical protein KC656_28065, partial [Myxococcales bacterium]|nr:hypothetical protein [Myxococcales bacterium]
MNRVSEPAPARPARGWPSALVAFGVGTVLLVGGLELGLRATGWLLQAGGIGPDDAEITVLAEGDSFTYGIGGLGFPTQLQAMLEDALGAGRVRVVNEGIPGQSTALLADRLPEHLARHRPDVVVIVIGENDDWNSVRLADPEGALSFAEKADAVLLNSRVYKFLKVARVGWSHSDFTEARDAALDAEVDPAQEAARTFAHTREVIGYPRGVPTGDYGVGDLTPWVHLDVGVDAEGIGPVLAHLDALGVGVDDDAFPPPALRDAWTEALLFERQGRYDEAVARLTALA